MELKNSKYKLILAYMHSAISKSHVANQPCKQKITTGTQVVHPNPILSY